MSDQGIAPGVGTTTLEDMQALMQANQPAFELLRKGFAAEYCEIPDRSAGALFPHLAKFRSMARALEADAYTRCCAEDWAGAMGRSLDGLRLGEDIPRGGTLLSLMGGIALQAIVRAQAWEIVPQLSAAEAGAAAQRLEKIMARHVPFAEGLLEEKWATETVMLNEWSRDPDWKQQLFGENIEPTLKDHLDTSTIASIQACYDRYMNALIARAKKPYRERGANPILSADPLIQFLFAGGFDKAFFVETCSTTQSALLLTTLALRTYQCEHHQYPDTLAALAPIYLHAIPADPFAAGQPLRYQRTAQGYLLYSIGPDGKDDNGTPSNDGQKTSQPHHNAVMENSTGDIVAGVNIK